MPEPRVHGGGEPAFVPGIDRARGNQLLHRLEVSSHRRLYQRRGTTAAPARVHVRAVRQEEPDGPELTLPRRPSEGRPAVFGDGRIIAGVPPPPAAAGEKVAEPPGNNGTAAVGRKFAGIFKTTLGSSPSKT